MKISRPENGFSLVEVVFALALAAFCLLTLLGLLSVGHLNNASILDQTAATSVAASVVSDLRTASGSPAVSNRYQIPIPTIPASGNSTLATHTLFFDDQGALSGTMDANANANLTPAPRYRVTLTFAPTAAKSALPVRVLVTWPALADANATASPSKFIGSFDTVIGLNLN